MAFFIRWISTQEVHLESPPLAGTLTFGLEGAVEVWDPGDTTDNVNGDGRHMRVEDPPEASFRVQYDRGTPEEELAILRDLSRLAGPDEQPHLMGKKALEPDRTLEILWWVGGAAVGGFLYKLGGDLYDGLKRHLLELFRRANRPQTVRLRLWVDVGRPLEVDIFVEDPSPADIEVVLDGGFYPLDELIKHALEVEPAAVLLVFRWWRGQFVLIHAFREDAFPIFFQAP